VSLDARVDEASIAAAGDTDLVFDPQAAQRLDGEGISA
jgi:hypothetical protein